MVGKNGLHIRNQKEKTYKKDELFFLEFEIVLKMQASAIYRLTLQYMLNYDNVSYHFYADDTRIYFKLVNKELCVSKLNTVFNAVQTLMFKRKPKLNMDKTNIMVVGNPLEIRNIDLTSNLKLDQADVNLSTKLGNPSVVFSQIFQPKS